MEQNQQLTAKQQKLSQVILNRGQLGEIEFVKKAIEFKKLHQLDQETLATGFAFLFTRIANLAGIKHALTEINKTDISEMLLNRFRNISLEEIDYAFKLERYGEWEKTEHFQLFNSEYVSSILNKYKKWIQRKRTDHKIKPTPEIPETTIPDESRVIESGIKRLKTIFKASNSVPIGNLYIYTYLRKNNLLKQLKGLDRQKIEKQAEKTINDKVRVQRRRDRPSESVKSKWIESECKRLHLEQYISHQVRIEENKFNYETEYDTKRKSKASCT